MKLDIVVRAKEVSLSIVKILSKEVPPLCISESLFSDSIPNSKTGYRCEERGSILVLSENTPKEVPF